jgi:hypothetical protein
MAASAAKVLSAHAGHATAAEATDVTSAKAADVASAKAAHVASATTVSSATTTARLGIGGKKAAGKHCTCQNHHHSSSHDIFLLEWAGLSATGSRQAVAGAKGKTPPPRWTGDGNACLSSLLNSGSLIGIQDPARTR